MLPALVNGVKGGKWFSLMDKVWGANRRAQCGKSACCVRRGGGWKRGMVEML
jgi:hypothetical protein